LEYYLQPARRLFYVAAGRPAAGDGFSYRRRRRSAAAATDDDDVKKLRSEE
jgi:hypothetical protein